MKARVFASAAIGLLGVLAGCNVLFGEAVQCTTDGDCVRIAPGTVCSPDRVCVAGGPRAGTGTGTGASADGRTDGAPSATPGGSAHGGDPCLARTKPQVTLGPGTLTGNVTLTCDKDYLLKGEVMVGEGASLTIAPGTTIKGDTSNRGGLFVRPGATISADGTRDRPIVFTSANAPERRAPFDWLGIAILGKAPPSGTLQNEPRLRWGGALPDDSSGVFRYVRVEYAARGIELAGVGRGTVIDHVQVRKSGGNCIRFLGGTVRAKYLICQYPEDEMFDVLEGYDGQLQFLIGQRTQTRQNEHHGVLVDAARAAIANAVLCGSDTTNDSYGVVVRNGGSLVLANSIVMGFGAGVDVVDTPASPLAITGSSFFGQHHQNGAYAEDPATNDRSSPLYDDDRGFDERAWLRTPGAGNTETVDPRIGACFDPAAPSFFATEPFATQPTLPPSPNSGFFDVARPFRGAVRDANDTWATAPWAVFAAR